MDYIRIYNELITKAQIRETPDEYYERHHIVPTSLGGANCYSNIVRLTLKEHKLAHLLLAVAGYKNQWSSVECFYSYNNPKRKSLRMTRFIRRNIAFNKARNFRESNREALALFRT